MLALTLASHAELETDSPRPRHVQMAQALDA